MKWYTSSCERASRSSPSVASPSSVSKRYSFSSGTHGSSRRCRASSSPSRVCSFSRTSSASRAASHSSRVPIVRSVILVLPSHPWVEPSSWRRTGFRHPSSHEPGFVVMLVATPAPADTDRQLRNPQGCGVVTETALGRARTGDETAFRELVDPYRAELQLHCYRILGSLQDAEDAVQETLLAAWRGLRGFEGRASLRAWLYRIATNRCLNVLRDRGRRPREVLAIPNPPEPTRTIEPTWLEPYPDALLEGIADENPGPDARYETRESVGLAFVAALQHLPPRQRAAVVLSDVLS